MDVRVAKHTDVPALSRTMARAFEDDPVMQWIFPPTRLTDRLRRFFGMQLRVIAIRHGVTFTAGGYEGGAIWLPPNQWQTSPADMARTLPTTMRIFGSRLPAAVRVLNHLEAHHPREEHYYLAAIGTDPPHQGTGVGTALLAPMLERCDREGVPAYLESSKERNVPFYARHGFEVTEAVDLPDGGPRLWAMWREPRA